MGLLTLEAKRASSVGSTFFREAASIDFLIESGRSATSLSARERRRLRTHPLAILERAGRNEAKKRF